MPLLPPHAAFQKLLTITLLILPLAARADLGSYEQAATKRQIENPAPPPSTQKTAPAKDCNDPDNSKNIDCEMNRLALGVMEGLLTAIAMIPVAMAGSSVERESGNPKTGVDKRHAHDRDIPHLALDLNWHDVDAAQDIRGGEARIEMGKGPLSVEASVLRYRQREPAATLDISHLHLLLRGTAQVAQLNLGVGAVIMHGRDDNSGPSVLAALSIFPTDRLSLDTRWTGGWINGSLSNEYDLALGWGMHGYAVRAGYRYNVAADESLHGPYIGLAWRY